jgi:hypothetical protein
MQSWAYSSRSVGVTYQNNGVTAFVGMDTPAGHISLDHHSNYSPTVKPTLIVTCQ